MSLEFTAVFNLYEALIESLFEDFTIKYDTSISSLYSSCRDAGIQLLPTAACTFI